MSTALGAINLNRLVVFVQVIESGSITAAAQRLGLTKAMVSTHMQRLEAELGASLLVRTTRRLALTEAGEAFHESARAIVQAAEDAVQALGEDTTDLHGILRITAPIDYGASVVMPVVVQLQRRHPELKVEVLAVDRVVDMVAEGIDVAIRLGKLADSSLQAVRIADMEFTLVASPELLRDLGGRRTRPSHFAEAPFIAVSVLPKPISWAFEGPRGQRETVQFERRLVVNTAHAARSAALAGGGLAMVGDFAVTDDLREGRLARALPGWSVGRGGVFAVFPSTRYRPPKVRAFVEAMRAHLGTAAA
jgi:DNA-binding transcriptional LysR family regulator